MNESNGVSFLDLVTPHKELREELRGVFERVLDTAGFIGGPLVEAFEMEFAAYCDTRYAVGVGSGTDALRFALTAVGVRQGDIVVTVPNTFIATTEAISQAGALPAFVDIDERTFNMDPQKLRDYLEGSCEFNTASGETTELRSGRRVSAVVPVHLYGQTADMDSIIEIAERHGLIVVEDACQAHGAEYYSRTNKRWQRAGSMGTAAAFSFYPGKNLGACGEGGAVTTRESAVAQKIRMLRDHGQAQKYYHDVEGYNGRLDALHAGMLSVKLKCMPAWTEQRRRAASHYRELFGDTEGVSLPYEPPWARAVYHLFVVRVEDRVGLQKHLTAAGIGTGIHYPVPLHLQKAYASLGYAKGDFPVSERVAAEIVSLPMFPGLTGAQQERVVENTMAFLPTIRALSTATV